MMPLSEAGTAMLVGLEGERGLPYRDQAGYLTVGVGHRLTVSELASGQIHVAGAVAIPWREGLSPLAIEAVLAQDTTHAAAAVTQLVTVPLTPGQFDCLTSFCFNVGAEAFAHSTLLKLLNQGRYEAVPGELRYWIHDHAGNVLPVLKARRETEITRWNAVT